MQGRDPILRQDGGATDGSSLTTNMESTNTQGSLSELETVQAYIVNRRRCPRGVAAVKTLLSVAIELRRAIKSDKIRNICEKQASSRKENSDSLAATCLNSVNVMSNMLAKLAL